MGEIDSVKNVTVIAIKNLNLLKAYEESVHKPLF